MLGLTTKLAEASPWVRTPPSPVPRSTWAALRSFERCRICGADGALPVEAGGGHGSCPFRFGGEAGPNTVLAAGWLLGRRVWPYF